ncbi:MAG: type IV pilus twitching motility protein PilT [Pedobacter sp.]|nr:MAG: type IV pilus twitching motility protein PilT [Pedobacter sp.]
MGETNGTDLHMSPSSKPMVRKLGQLEAIEQAPVLNDDMNKALLYEILTEQQREHFEKTKDLDLSYTSEATNLRFRVNIFQDKKGISAVFRLISTTMPTMEGLGLSPVVKDFANLHKGLVLVTGPAASGKSTTLAAIIDHINKTRDDHVLTVEDPIEYVHVSQRCLVNQREVGRNTKTFASALKGALREDPDVIMVGEMRDLETIELAITAAETGHLVFGTLHTGSAAKTIDRVINTFPSKAQAQIRAMLSESLKGVVSQQLLFSVDGSRVLAQEILVGTPAIGNMIRDGKTFQIPSIMQASKKDGMSTMDGSLMDLVTRKIITPDEAYRKAFEKKTFEHLLTTKPDDIIS